MENQTKEEYQIPKTLQMFSRRMEEQNTCFMAILDDINTKLDATKKIFDQYDSNLSDEIVKLASAIEDYKVKASKTAIDVSEKLGVYALNAIQNVEALRESISSITDAINAINIK